MRRDRAVWEEEIITRFEQRREHLCSIKWRVAACDAHHWAMWSTVPENADHRKLKVNASEDSGPLVGVPGLAALGVTLMSCGSQNNQIFKLCPISFKRESLRQNTAGFWRRQLSWYRGSFSSGKESWHWARHLPCPTDLGLCHVREGKRAHDLWEASQKRFFFWPKIS